MITALLSLGGVILSCLGTVIATAIMFGLGWFIRLKRKPNEKQIRALRIALPTNAERPSELHPVDLERLAVYVYQRLGYRNVKYTGLHSSTDGGIDVWMLSRQGHVEVVQCKQWKSKVGSGDLIEFAKAMRLNHAEVGHYWSPNGFSKPAQKYAENKENIILLGDYQIRKLLEKVIEIDKEVAAQQPAFIPEKKTRKSWTVAQVVIIFGMVLIACALIYSLLGAIATGGS